MKRKKQEKLRGERELESLRGMTSWRKINMWPGRAIQQGSCKSWGNTYATLTLPLNDDT